MGYTWGYLKRSALAKLDIDETEATTLNWINRFTTYANEAMTQICSAIKPKPCFFTKTVTSDDIVNGEYSFDITSDDVNDDAINFISFGSGINTVTYQKFAGTPFEKTVIETAHNDIVTFSGYNTVTVKIPGTYKISYNARWIDFAIVADNLRDNYYIDVPNDILDCIPSYIASQLYGIDDEYKSSKYRNEYEMLLARIDNKPADNTGTIKIGGDW